MRIGLNGIPLLSPLTGIGHYTRSLALELQSLGDDRVRMFYGRGWSSDVRSIPVDNIVGAKAAVKRWIPRAYEVSRAIQQVGFSASVYREKLDVFHETTGFAFRFDGPTVTTIHDLAWRRFPSTHPRERVAAYERWIGNTVRRSAQFVTVSSAIKQEVVDILGVEPEKITTIPEAPRNAFHPRTQMQCQDALCKLSLAYRGFLLCVGTLEPRKNVNAAIAAFGKLPCTERKRWPLVLVGMRGWLTTSTEDQLASLVQSGSVRVLGYVDDDDLACLCAAARMLIYPSLYEGFGLPPLEAMASGTPVISSNASSLPEVVGEAGIQVDPHDVDALHEGIRRLTEDDALWDALRSKGLARAARFSWRRCAQETLAVYQQVLGEAAA